MHDWRSYWFLLAGAQGLLLSTGLAVRAGKSKQFLPYLAILLGVLSVELLTNFAVSVHYTSQPGAIPFWILNSYLLIPPSLLMLARHSAGLSSLQKKKTIVLYIPAMIEVMVESCQAIFRAAGLRTSDLQSVTAWSIFTEIIPVLATIPIIIWWGIKMIASSSVKQHTGQLTDRRFKNNLLRYGLLICYFFFSILWLIEVFFGWRFADLLAQLLAGSMLILGYTAFLRTGIFDHLLFVPIPATSPSPWPYNDDDAIDRLILLMETEKLYSQSRLSIDDLAGAMHLPKRYLSHLISARLNTNVITFINKYRVEEVIRKMKDPAEQHKTILALAMEAGFSSKSTFNQVFKQQTGKTPSEYLKSRS